MVLVRYCPPNGGYCYYDGEADECLWVLPPGVEEATLPDADLTTDLNYTRRVQKAYSKAVNKRQVSHRAGLQSYSKKQYVEARRQFNQAIRWGLVDPDVYSKDAEASLVVWDMDPSQDNLQSCHKAFERLLEKVNDAGTLDNLVEVAKIYIHGGSYYQALEFLNRLRGSFPQSPLDNHILFLMALVLAYLNTSLDQCMVIIDHLSSCTPEYQVPRDVLQLLCAWVEMRRNRPAHSLGYCEEGLRLYLERHKGLDRATPGLQNPLQYFSNPEVWHEAGQIALQGEDHRHRNYLLAKLCYQGAIIRGKRDEAEYLMAYSCMRHLSITGDEPIEWLGKGFRDNRTSLTLRIILKDLSLEWAGYFAMEERCIIRLQSWFRMLLAKEYRQYLVEEREFIRHQRSIWAMNIKWEMRRALGSYTDRKKKVMKRDFFKLWRQVHEQFIDIQQLATLVLQCFARVVIAKARVRKEKALIKRLSQAEKEVQALMESSLKKSALAGFRYAIWTIDMKPYATRIQCAWRRHRTHQAVVKRRRVALLMLRRSNKLIDVIFRRWHEEARQNKRDRAAIQIQRIYRGYCGRLLAKKTLEQSIKRKEVLSSMLYQTIMQVFFSKWYNNAQSDLECVFARRIQCACRQKLAREKVKRRRFILEQITLNDEKRLRRTLAMTYQVAFKTPWVNKKRAIAIVKLQCAARAFVAYKKVQHLIEEREFRARMVEERQRIKVQATAKLALRFWRLASRKGHADRQRMAVVIQRVYRGYRVRRSVKEHKYWVRRRRINRKKESKLYAAAVYRCQRMSMRTALDMWQHTFFLSRHAAVIQGLFRGNMERRFVKRVRRVRLTMRTFLTKLSRIHDYRVPLYCLRHWWMLVLHHRAATVIQCNYRGRIGRKEAQKRSLVWSSIQSSLQKHLLWHNRKVMSYNFQHWRITAHRLSAAIKIQTWVRRFLTYTRIKRIRAVARIYVAKYVPVGVKQAINKRRANIILQSAFRREKAYRRVRALSYHLHVIMEEHETFLSERKRWQGLKSQFLHWQAAAKAHRAKIILIQSWVRVLLVKKRVRALRVRKARIDWGMATMARKRKIRAMKVVFHAIEEALVEAMVARVKMDISLKVDPTSPEVTTMAEKLRRPISAPSAAKTMDATMDLVPFLADGKIAPDLFSHQFIAAKHTIQDCGMLRWARCQSLTFRERLSLIMITPVLIIDSPGLGGLTTCLKCLVANQQKAVVEKLVFFHTLFQDKELEEVLTCIKGCGQLQSLSLVNTPVSFTSTQFLISYLVEHPLEELVLDNNRIHSAGVAGIIRALQAQLVISRLVIDKNSLRTGIGGYELGDLLCNCASLKTLSMVETLRDERCAHSFITQAFRKYTQCRLDLINLSGNPCMKGEAAIRLVEALSDLGVSLHESEIGFVTSVDLSRCCLTDTVCPAIVKLLQDRTSSERLRVVLEGNEISATGGRMLVQAADLYDAELVMNGNPFGFEFVKQTLLTEGRTVTKHLSKIVMADMILQRAISPYAQWNVVPPMPWG